MGATTSNHELPADGGVQRIPVEELSAHLATLESELSGGRSIELTRGDEVIAEMKGKAPSLVSPLKQELPDFMGRMRAIWGDRVLDTDGTQIIREDRDARG